MKIPNREQLEILHESNWKFKVSRTSTNFISDVEFYYHTDKSFKPIYIQTFNNKEWSQEELKKLVNEANKLWKEKR
jgi:hypothetical protein